MRLIAVLGSPHEEGGSNTVAHEVIKGAKQVGYEVIVYDANTMNIRGCQGCMYCRQNNADCNLEDDLKQYWQQLHDADALLVAAPVYASQICGPMITYMNRHYCLLNGGKPRIHAGIKLVGVFSQGRTDLAGYDSVYDWYLGDFENRDMQLVEKLVHSPRMDEAEKEALLKHAFDVGLNL